MWRNAHPWRVMAVIFGCVLLCSYCLDKLFRPAGDAVLLAVESRPAVVTGTIDPCWTVFALTFRSSASFRTAGSGSSGFSTPIDTHRRISSTICLKTGRGSEASMSISTLVY